MSDSFTSHKDAARALLLSGADLGRRSGQFCGGILFDETMSEKQTRWLAALLDRHKLPPLEGGVK